jgi:hypothetical protein
VFLIREKIENFSARPEEDGKKMYIEGIFLQGEIVNGNGRKYPIGVLDEAVSRYNEEFIKTNRAGGELNHPESPEINPERLCIRTVSLEKEGNNYIGKALVLSTPLGQLVRNLIEDEYQIAVSSRGLASVRMEGDVEVIENDFYICAAADVVSNPSAPDAFVQGVMEGRQWIYENGFFRPQALEEAKKKIKKAPAKNLDVVMREAVKSIFDSIQV